MGNTLGKSKTQSIGEDDIVVFLVGPAGAGKSTLMNALNEDSRVHRNAQSLDPSTRNVQAWTYTFDQIPANIVLVDTPSFHTEIPGFDAEGIMRKWIQLSKFPQKCQRSGILYLHDLARDPEEHGLVMRVHLNTFAKTFPQGCRVPSRVYVIPTIDKGLRPGTRIVQRHFPKLQAIVESLRSSWNISMSPQRFQGQPETAYNAVLGLLRDIGYTATRRVYVPPFTAPSARRGTSNKKVEVVPTKTNNTIVDPNNEKVGVAPTKANDVSSFCTRASAFSAKFHTSGDMADLEQAIVLRREVLALSPTASSHRELARCLSDRFDKRAEPADIDEAITLTRSALKYHSPGHPDWVMSHQCFALYNEKKIMEPAPKADPEGVRTLVMDAVYDTVAFLPPRLINTHVGILYDRDALISAFENSQQFKQLLSSAKTCPTTLHDQIRNTVSTYFKYAMLSHRWGKDEPLLRHIQGQIIYGMDPTQGLLKLYSFCITACNHGYLWAWSDTCCIDKDSTVELANAIASMFSWYRRSALTIVYLADVSSGSTLSSSVWFMRGWTLQELLAPHMVLFYTREWFPYKNCNSSNHKVDDTVLNELEHITGIAPRHLTAFLPGLDEARLRLQWASGRRTTEPEDIAYSLFGIFNVFLPVIPGESAENALGRLLTEIILQSGDISVLDWVGEASSLHSYFPAQITSYQTTPTAAPVLGSELLSFVSRTQESVVLLHNLFDSLLMLDPPHFIGNRLRLPCIAYQVIAVRLQLPDAPKYVYEIQAEGIIPFEITPTSKLTDTSLSPPRYILIRPWHSQFLSSSTEADSTGLDKLTSMLGQPFSALLLEEQFRNVYKRIASSSTIVAHPDGTSSILKCKVETLNIV